MNYRKEFDLMMRGRTWHITNLTQDKELITKMTKELNRERHARRRDLWRQGDSHYVDFAAGSDGVLVDIEKKGGEVHRTRKKSYSNTDYLKPVTGEQDAINNRALMERLEAEGINLEPYGDGLANVGDKVVVCVEEHEFTNKEGEVIGERHNKLLVRFNRGIICYFDKIELRKV